MKVEIEVVSKETIKPSSPTPSHLRHYQLSFLDQISRPVYMPFIFFYESSFDTELSNGDKSGRLKVSLSETLTLFYPFAGRLVDNISVDCNDEGVTYLEAQAKCKLFQVVNNPIPSEFNKFLPRELDDVDDTLLAVQVIFFNCGGLAVGLCISHKIADAFSAILFVKSWAATARGDRNMNTWCPQFESAKLFPPRNILRFKPTTWMNTNEKVVIKRFVFSNPMVSALRDKYTDRVDEDCSIRPTRFEALLAFIWNRFAAATRIESSRQRQHALSHSVNLRWRKDPPLPENFFGNLCQVVITNPSMDSGNECRDLVRQTRDKVNNIDKVQESDHYLQFRQQNARRIEKGELVTIRFTSLCRLPVYEIDFGWGKPVRFGSTNLKVKNFVVFMDTREGDGIEAWINFEEKDMAKFELDKELLAYVSPSSG